MFGYAFHLFGVHSHVFGVYPQLSSHHIQWPSSYVSLWYSRVTGTQATWKFPWYSKYYSTPKLSLDFSLLLEKQINPKEVVIRGQGKTFLTL